MYKGGRGSKDTPRPELSQNFPHPEHNTNGCTLYPSPYPRTKKLQMEPPLQTTPTAASSRAPQHKNRHMNDVTKQNTKSPTSDIIGTGSHYYPSPLWIARLRLFTGGGGGSTTYPPHFPFFRLRCLCQPQAANPTPASGNQTKTSNRSKNQCDANQSLQLFNYVRLHLDKSGAHRIENPIRSFQKKYQNSSTNITQPVTPGRFGDDQT